MGGARWVEFGSEEELARVVAYLRNCRSMTYEHPSNSMASQVWISPLDENWSLEEGEDSSPSFGLKFDYSFGSDHPSELAMLVVRELARRFAVTRIGAGSIGWYPDSEWSHPKTVERYGPYKSWAEWARNWKPEMLSCYYNNPDKAVEYAKCLEQFVVDQFENFDNESKTVE